MSDYEDNSRDDDERMTYKKKYKPNIKKKSKLNFEDDDDEDDEDEEENEESENSKTSIKKTKSSKEKKTHITSDIVPSIEENHPKKNEHEYLAQIEQLQNELDLEKKISDSIKDSGEYTSQINELQNSLVEKNTILSQLKSTSKKQGKALKLLRTKLDEEINKIEANKFISKSNNNLQKLKLRVISPYKIKKVPKNEAVNIVLKVKDKEISASLIKMNIIQKENEILQKELYKNNDYQENLSILDSSRECSQKIKELLSESKILNSQLETHQKCIKEFEKYNNEIDQLKKIIKQLKENRNQVNLDIRNKQLELYKLCSIEENANLKKSLSPRNNLADLNLYKKFKEFTLGSKNSAKNTSLPSIPTTKLIKSTTKSILTREFCEKLKKYLGENEKEYDDLIQKISDIEKKGFSIQNKHKNELKIFSAQIGNLDEQFKTLKTERREKGSNIKVMKFKLHIAKSEIKHIIKDFLDLKIKLQNANNNSKQKDNLILVLVGKINSIRKKAKIMLEKQEDKIEKYDDIKNDNKNTENKKNLKEGLEKILETIKEEKSDKFDYKIPLNSTKSSNISNRPSFSSEKEDSLKNNLNDKNNSSQSNSKDLSKDKKRNRKSMFNAKKNKTSNNKNNC